MSGQRDNGQDHVEAEQRLQVGDVLDVPVDDLPGAGYRWEPAGQVSGLVRLPDTEDAARPTGDRTGVGGTSRRVLHLRADQPGAYEVVLRLVRPWEPPGTAPAQERRVRVRVEAPPGPG